MLKRRYAEFLDLPLTVGVSNLLNLSLGHRHDHGVEHSARDEKWWVTSHLLQRINAAIFDGEEPYFVCFFVIPVSNDKLELTKRLHNRILTVLVEQILHELLPGLKRQYLPTP